MEQYAEALSACEEALRHFQGTGPAQEVPKARYRVATILDHLDRDDEALQQLSIVVEEAASIGDHHRQLYALNRQGNIYTSRGDYELAIERLGEALALPLGPDDSSSMIHARANRGIAWYTIGNYVNALEDLELARDAYEASGHRKDSPQHT